MTDSSTGTHPRTPKYAPPASGDLHREPDVVVTDPPTWDQVAREYGRFLYTVAYRLTGNHDDAQDLVQEVLVRVQPGLATYRPGSNGGLVGPDRDERVPLRRPVDHLPGVPWESTDAGGPKALVFEDDSSVVLVVGDVSTGELEEAARQATVSRSVMDRLRDAAGSVVAAFNWTDSLVLASTRPDRYVLG